MTAEEETFGKWKRVNGEKVWNPRRDLENITVETLTRESAQKLGHIAWIEDADPASAIRKMVKAIQTKPVNCAVWVNATHGEPVDWRTKVSQWRTQNEARILSGPVEDRDRHFDKLYVTAQEVSEDLPSYFNRITGIPRSIENHMSRRMSDIFQAIATKGCRFQLRAGANDITRQHITDHTDGGARLRFIESISSRATYLFSNAAVVYGPDVFYDKDDENRMNYCLPRHGRFTAYEVPDHSLTLLTDGSLPWMPILHGEPFLPSDQPVERRTVLTYDFIPL